MEPIIGTILISRGGACGPTGGSVKVGAAVINDRAARRIDEAHVMIPIPVWTWIGGSISVRVDSEVCCSPCRPTRDGFLSVGDNVIAVFRIAKLVRNMSSDAGRSRILRFSVPGWIAGKTFVFRAGRMGIPTQG